MIHNASQYQKYVDYNIKDVELIVKTKPRPKGTNPVTMRATGELGENTEIRVLWQVG